MKKYMFLALALALCGTMLVGCGCMNSNAEMTTVPTTAPKATVPTTAATTAPTTLPTTMPETEPTGTYETAGENGIVETEDAGETGPEGRARSHSGSRIPPMG